jgi:hypothetical protein
MGFIPKARFAPDSPLEGDGFELPVFSTHSKTLVIQPF